MFTHLKISALKEKFIQRPNILCKFLGNMTDWIDRNKHTVKYE